MLKYIHPIDFVHLKLVCKDAGHICDANLENKSNHSCSKET